MKKVHDKSSDVDGTLCPISTDQSPCQGYHGTFIKKVNLESLLVGEKPNKAYSLRSSKHTKQDSNFLSNYLWSKMPLALSKFAYEMPQTSQTLSRFWDEDPLKWQRSWLIYSTHIRYSHERRSHLRDKAAMIHNFQRQVISLVSYSLKESQLPAKQSPTVSQESA